MVDVGGGAIMNAPLARLEWNLRYGDLEQVRYDAAEVIAAYRYLIHECTCDEACRRIKLMRAAMQGVGDDD